MLTSRQQEILCLIIQLYRKYGEPIGSKTLLEESNLDVSSATIRNDMVALEKVGLLTKAHSSSGRIPSGDGYRFYVNRIIEHPEDLALSAEAIQGFEEIFESQTKDTFQLTQLLADMLVSLTGYTAIVLGQSQSQHRFEEIRLFLMDDGNLIALLMTDQGHIENEVFEGSPMLNREDVHRMTEIINSELHGSSLTESYQRMKLSIPLQIQRAIGYQFDLSSIVEKTIFHLKTHTYWVTGKSNIFDLIDGSMEPDAMKLLLNLVDGSREMIETLEGRDLGVDVLFGDEFAPNQLDHVNMVTAAFDTSSQRMTLGLLGPIHMPYERIIATMTTLVDKLTSV